MIETVGSDPLDDRSYLAIKTDKYDRASAVALGSTLVLFTVVAKQSVM